MKLDQHDSQLSILLAQIIVVLFEELKSARGDRISTDDVGLLNEILAQMEFRTKKLEQLDAQNPEAEASK